MLFSRIRELFQRNETGRYFANDLDQAINDEGLRRIQAARAAFHPAGIDKELRRNYERDQSSSLPGIEFDSEIFESIRSRALTALADASLSPCAFMHGNQAERQGIPR